MQIVQLVGGAVVFAGALDLDRSDAGISPRRLPAWTRPQLQDPLLKAVVAMPSGVRLEFATDADVVELDVLTTTLQTSDRVPAPPAFDLVIDGVFVGRRTSIHSNLLIVDPVTFNARREPGSYETLRFDGLGSAMKRVEVWLPQAATVRLRQLRVSDGATTSAAPDRAWPRWVHYGSSISHCMEADGPTGTWPAIAAQLGGLNLQSLGLGGSCHLDQFAARTIRDLPADLISLKVGINVVNGDTLKERTFVSSLYGFIDTVREGHSETPLLLVSPIICPVAENHPGPTATNARGVVAVFERSAALSYGCLTVRRIRELIAAAVDDFRARGDANIHYLDGLRLFGEDDLADLPDGLHPNAAGYQRMGERFHALAFGVGGAFAQT